MTQQTLVALFHSMEEADAARRQLTAAGIPAADMHLQKGPIETATTARGDPARHETFFQWLFGTRPSDADIERYRSHVAKGGAALTVRADNRDANRLSGLLKQHNLVEVEGGQEYVTSAGSPAGSSSVPSAGAAEKETAAAGAHGAAAARDTPSSAAQGASAMKEPTPTAQGAAAMKGPTSAPQGTATPKTTPPSGAQDSAATKEVKSPISQGAAQAKETTGPAAQGAAAMRGPTTNAAQGAAATEETRLPTAHEELAVGKRQVSEPKTYHIRRYIVERPAEQRVSLHEETVEVERLAASGRSAGEQPFEEKIIEITEMHEEPVISKRIVADEEVVVRKKGLDRVETVRGTVRESRVEVDRAAAGDKPRNPATPPSTGKR